MGETGGQAWESERVPTRLRRRCEGDEAVAIAQWRETYRDRAAEERASSLRPQSCSRPETGRGRRATGRRARARTWDACTSVECGVPSNHSTDVRSRGTSRALKIAP